MPAGPFGGPYELRLPLFLQPLGRALKKRSAAPASPPCFRRRRRSAPLLFESTRSVSLALQQNKNLSVLSYVEVFWWARVDVASRASKKAPQGLFCPPDHSAGRCCSNPPLRVKLEIPDKTKNQRIFYAGLFGGRGWIRTTEAESSRFTVCPHWPLGNTPIFNSQSHRLPVYITTGARVCQCF